MSDLETVRALARGGLSALERSRRRIDDLNVYPVPDGDTGTNLTLTGRAVIEALDAAAAADRATLAKLVTRSALMGARGNSGVILSQIVRGAAEALGEADRIDGETICRALRSACDAAYRAVRRPVEGTMLSVIRELAEEGEARRGADISTGDLLAALVARGEAAVARTPEQLAVLREAGVVDAGGAGLLEIVRGIAATFAGEELPDAPDEREELGLEAIHRELSPFRYCTVFVVEGDRLDRGALERELDTLGDSLLVVGDETALKVHVHTDDPGRALSLGTAAGAIAGVEIANMHEQTAEREGRLLELVHDGEPASCGAIAVVSGDGNAVLFRSLGVTRIVEGGQTMNPSTAELVAAIDESPEPEVVVLPNNSNVILSAEQAARLAAKPVQVVQASSLQAGLAAMVAFDPERPAGENAAEMCEALDAVATGEVAIASRDASMNGFAVRRGAYLGLVEDEPVAAGDDFAEVARAVVDRLLSEPREMITLLAGADAPDLGTLQAYLRDSHPSLEVDVQAGGQPHYPLLVSAE